MQVTSCDWMYVDERERKGSGPLRGVPPLQRRRHVLVFLAVLLSHFLAIAKRGRVQPEHTTILLCCGGFSAWTLGDEEGSFRGGNESLIISEEDCWRASRGYSGRLELWGV